MQISGTDWWLVWSIFFFFWYFYKTFFSIYLWLNQCMLAICFGQTEFICKCHPLKVIHLPLLTQREKMQNPRKTQGRRPGQQQESFSQDLINHGDHFLRYPKKASCLARNQKFRDKMNEKAEEKQLQDKLHLVKSEPVAEWIHGSLGARPDPRDTRVGYCPH